MYLLRSKWILLVPMYHHNTLIMFINWNVILHRKTLVSASLRGDVETLVDIIILCYMRYFSVQIDDNNDYVYNVQNNGGNNFLIICYGKKYKSLKPVFANSMTN